MGRHWIICLLVCASLAAPMPLSAAAGTATPGVTLEQGLVEYRAGHLEAAAALLRAFAATAPPAAQRNEAWLTLARIALDQGQADVALASLRELPAEAQSPTARYLQGRAMLAAGNQEEGLALLQQLDPQTLAAVDREGCYAVLAEAKVREGEALQAVVLYQQAANLTGAADGGSRWLAAAHPLLRDQLDDGDLADVAQRLAGTAVGADALLQQALRAAESGDMAKATSLADRAAGVAGVFPYRDEALQLYERLTGKPWLKRSIGVVLPLSGRYGEFGLLVRRGIELAAAAHNAKQPPVEFVFRDGGNDAEENARAVDRLAHDDRVMAIIGPMTGGAAVAAARRAEQARVPLLTLSQRDGLVETGPFIFRSSLTPRQQVDTLLRYAMETRGLRTFGVMVPENRLAQEMAELFRNEALRRGGTVVGVQSYAENATDFRRQIKLLKGEDPDLPDAEEEESTADGEKGVRKPPEPPPFEALFIPDDAKRVGLIAPQLVFYGIDGLQLLGSNGWNTPDLIRIGGRFVDGAVFVDGFFRDARGSAVQGFVKDCQAQFQEDPSILEAQGYDAASILLGLMDRPEVRSRDGLRQALGQVRGYPGLTGVTSFPPSRDADKLLYLLQVKNGKIVPAN